MDGNTESMIANTDVLNVLGDNVPSLSDFVLDRVRQGRSTRTQVLDGSKLPQHDEKVPYALTHVIMNFDNEDDLIKCIRMLQWSDARMRAAPDPKIMWAWREGFRDGSQVEFAVAWYSEEFFQARKDAFLDRSHSGYYSQFGLEPKDIKIRHEIL
ncbi:MAG: hypothetical protein JWR51_3847 [Devosia sp.]|uniref:hypothetical protein n=1 Tax=Devosia sp. TaxID=1871048 RepID=UPI002630E4AB|nr:hypothetical protein [Devosia sp.]MDB5530744.1 hypothetical protein [Devosia sp.]